MSKLIMLKGLPASGKSTYAKELVAQGYKRVNKDELRAMIDSSKWSKGNEKLIKQLEYSIVVQYIEQGYNVVVDNTNFGYEKMWKEFTESNSIEFEVKFFDTPVMECVDRDAKRGDKSVGVKVIFGMYDKYLKPKPPEYSDDKQNAYIFDIDGTLAKMTGRSPYDYTQVHTDIPNPSITMIARLLKLSGLPIILCSGRKAECKEATEKWLQDNAISYDFLFMRATDDSRKDSIVKKEIYDTHIKDKYNVLAVFDDRNQVVDMWRSLGLTCLQCDYGNF